MPPADNTPNFDTMTPEEIMAWMESLAKRQGASEGFTTAADMQVAEIDPETVEIDEPGYVPYGKDPKKWAEEEAARKAAKAAPAPPPRQPAAPPPSAQPLRPAAQVSTPPQPTRPAAPPAPPPQPLRPPAAQAPSPPPAPKPAQPEIPLGQGTLSWLESLAADQGGDLPELDLASLAAEITPAAPPASPSKPAVNPMDWLESLTQGQEEETETAPPVTAQEAANPFAEGVDPMSWLESIARRQGARNEELTTPANVNVPTPGDAGSIEGPGYTPYSFDTLGVGSRPAEEAPAPEARTPETEPEPAALEDPAAWLDSLASSQGFTPEVLRGAAAKPEEPEDEENDIQEALARGEDIPPPPEDVVKPTPQQPALIDLITEPPPVTDVPDWLRDEPEVENDLDDIFATTEAELPTPSVSVFNAPAAEPEVDVHDPWAEALEYERQQDISELPDWYVQNINDPARRAAVDRRLTGEPEIADEPLEAAELPAEEELPLGQPEALPDWLQDALVGADEQLVLPEMAEDIPDWLQADIEQPEAEDIPVEVVAEPTADIPDWLKSVDVDEVPDWLKETISPPAATVTPTPPPAPVVPQQPVVSQPIVSAPPPVPTPAPAAPAVPVAQPAAAQLDAQATLNDARASINNQDIDGGLRHYEALIRMNAELDAVSTDLVKLADKIKTNPAIYRVLGDSLMRQGKLQAALDTYRKALNQL
ncbi:MAG: hypothetical protein HZC41_16775 [Chloroflexi bacterium]|nr:hypothetical protein [Chloroflexota bacterium]